jgi:hypothetical protein
MNKTYKVKVKSGGRVHGLMGHNAPRSWDEVVAIIKDEKIYNVEYVKHYDKTPVVNTKWLSGQDMLRLWKAVELAQK